MNGQLQEWMETARLRPHESLDTKYQRSSVVQSGKRNKVIMKEESQLHKTIPSYIIRMISDDVILTFIQNAISTHPIAGPTSRFEDLSSDIYLELVRRYPEFQDDVRHPILFLPSFLVSLF